MGKTYYVHEVKGPGGYTCVEEDVEIKLNADGSITLGDNDSATLDPDTGTITIKDEPFGLSVLKVDENGNALSGAKMIFYEGDALQQPR